MMDSEMEALAMRMLAPVRLVPAYFPGEEFVGGMVSSSSVGMQRSEESRVPQWSQAETRELIAIRAELERDFTQAKRNKTLWEAVATRMAERGFRRTPEQCKCKWKNLVNRYKIESLRLVEEPASWDWSYGAKNFVYHSSQKSFCEELIDANF